MLTFQARGHQNALFCMQIFKKISGVLPPTPIAGGGDPSLHSPPARPSAVRVGASRPRLRGPKRTVAALDICNWGGEAGAE